MNIKPVHATIVAFTGMCAVFFTTVLWWNGTSPSAWTTFMLVCATIVSWVPFIAWSVHAYDYTHPEGWEYIGDDKWKRTLYYRDSVVVMKVKRRRGTSAYRVACYVPDPFVDDDLYIAHEYDDCGELQNVLDEASLSGVATLVEWCNNYS